MWKWVLGHWVSACQEVVVVPHSDGSWSNGDPVKVDPGGWEGRIELSPHGEDAEHPPDEEGDLEALDDAEQLDSSLDVKASAAPVLIEPV